MSFDVRTATITDIDELTRLFDEYRMFYEQAGDIKLAREFLTDRMEKNQSTIFIATNDQGRGCGFTQLYPSFSSVSAQSIWILNDLYVEASARKNGVGRQLMNKARDFAIATAAKGVLLETAKTNRQAQALYESLGYEVNTEGYYYFLSVDTQ